MNISSRVSEISESITLKLNAKAVAMAESGKHIYNLTAGQLPFRPLPEFSALIRDELDFIRSYQYSPVNGYPELREKILKNWEKTRGMELGEDFDCVVTNGGKHAVSNVMGTLLDHGDEVIVLAPYWVTYPEIIKFCKGVPKIIYTSPFDVFTPSIDQIKKEISPRTKAIIVNSPNNPTGTHYSDKWMSDFAALMIENPHVNIICDEIYYQLFYFDPKPTFYYQKNPELLERTIIVDGISKTLASTGLRLGWVIAPKKLCKAITKLQGQTTSGANSLVQRALVNFDFDLIEAYLEPIKKHLRDNAQTLREVFKENDLSHTWYQSSSAFYYLIDFSHTPIIEKYKKSENDLEDHSPEICEALLETKGVATVPGVAFGMNNSARMSLVMEKEPFREALEIIVSFLNSKD